MGRRGSSAVDDLIGGASRLPWKVGAALALIAFVILHIVAEQSIPGSVAPHPPVMGAVVLRGYVHVFATFLQFIIPATLLIGAGVSFFNRRRSTELVDSVTAGLAISSLSWQEFEALVAQGFRQRGFDVAERGGDCADGGIDLVLVQGHERFLVQSKQWRARQVGVSVVRELYGVMAAEGVTGGYVVTSGSFTKDAKAFSAGRNIDLIGGRELAALLHAGQAAKPVVPAAPPVSALRAPECPKCRSPMVLRTAKRGAHTGRSFWGCLQYPRCQAIIARE